jgi:hypothetical protein
MTDESKKILDMLEQGKINAEQAEKLLSALNANSFGSDIPTPPDVPPIPGRKAQWFKVRVYDDESETPKVKVSLPVNVLRILAKLGMTFKGAMPNKLSEQLKEKGINFDLENMDAKDLEQLIDSLTQNGPLKIVEVNDKNQRVEIFVE